MAQPATAPDPAIATAPATNEDNDVDDLAQQRLADNLAKVREAITKPGPLPATSLTSALTAEQQFMVFHACSSMGLCAKVPMDYHDLAETLCLLGLTSFDFRRDAQAAVLVEKFVGEWMRPERLRLWAEGVADAGVRGPREDELHAGHLVIEDIVMEGGELARRCYWRCEDFARNPGRGVPTTLRLSRIWTMRHEAVRSAAVLQVWKVLAELEEVAGLSAGLLQDQRKAFDVIEEVDGLAVDVEQKVDNQVLRPLRKRLAQAKESDPNNHLLEEAAPGKGGQQVRRKKYRNQHEAEIGYVKLLMRRGQA
ncbi:hypothetical protein Tdes44962_MAKER06318 [Teratosphaeria destructans]|uniref:Uncharacterized protein n=1 Tax=Teratosphaeria destructans TaxID=418781 RepID=A0A9W7SI29_9PEZI|nr:hypothetical protein Tdes44962_MAKER06318 [Teratosphaeria destructans]